MCTIICFYSDDSILSCEPIQLISPDESVLKIPLHLKTRKDQSERLIAHFLKYNHSYNGLEEMARIMNLMDNTSMQLPESRHKLLKEINPRFKVEFHIHCSKCNNYIPTPINKAVCSLCSKQLKTSNSTYFVYIPIEQQLRKVINENWDEISFYPYSHDEVDVIKDIYDCIQYKKIQKKYENKAKVLSLVCGADGAVAASKSLWAIQLYQNYLKPSMRYVPQNVLCVAFFHESFKPKMKDFFFPLLNELKNINKAGGLVFEKNKTKYRFMPIITHFVADLPAKVEIQGMISYNGYNACGYCFHPGVLIKQQTEKSKSIVRYVRREKIDELRSHEKVLEIYTKLKRVRELIDGIKEMSCMIASCDFDLISGFGIDYMHCALLGVMRKCWSLWLESKNHDKPFYIKPKDQAVLSKRIVDIKPITEITRKPGPISKRQDYKANELRTLLLYYLRYCLVGLLNKRYVDHFQLFSFAHLPTFKRQNII